MTGVLIQKKESDVKTLAHRENGERGRDRSDGGACTREETPGASRSLEGARRGPLGGNMAQSKP